MRLHHDAIVACGPAAAERTMREHLEQHAAIYRRQQGQEHAALGKRGRFLLHWWHEAPHSGAAATLQCLSLPDSREFVTIIPDAISPTPGPAVPSTCHFDDPEAFRGAIAAASADLVLGGKGRFGAVLTRVVLLGAHVQRACTTRPNVLRAGVTPRAVFSFAPAGDGVVTLGGRPLSPGEMALNPPSGEAYVRTEAGAAWNTASFPLPDLAVACLALNGAAMPSPGAGPRVFRPSPGPLHRLLRLRVDAITFVDGPLSSDSCSAALLDAALLEAAALCFAEAERPPERLGERRARQIVMRLEERVSADPGSAPTLAEICADLAVPVRTLNTACRGMVGMGADRYLRQRRLHAVRRALLQGGIGVTQAATAQSFWELGRFAAAYRATFGERPSDTLRRGADGQRPAAA